MPKKQQPNGQAAGVAKPTQKEMVQAALKAGDVNPKSNVDLSIWIKKKWLFRFWVRTEGFFRVLFSLPTVVHFQ